MREDGRLGMEYGYASDLVFRNGYYTGESSLLFMALPPEGANEPSYRWARSLLVDTT